MIVEFEFGTRLLRPTVQKAPVEEVVIEQLDAGDGVPLRTVCWLEESKPGAFESALEDDRTVAGATQVVATEHGYQYQVTHSQDLPGTEVYYAAVEQNGIFVSGTSEGKRWEVQMRFPDRDAFAEFREDCEEEGLDLETQDVHENEQAPHAQEYPLSEPQREILLLAAEKGYFAVPRDASLADLAEELDVSSQAASERLRRGLDSLVDRALLTPE